MSKAKSEKLPIFPIILSVKFPECSRFLLNLGGCSLPASPLLRLCILLKGNASEMQKLPVSSVWESKALSECANFQLNTSGGGAEPSKIFHLGCIPFCTPRCYGPFASIQERASSTHFSNMKEM